MALSDNLKKIREEYKLTKKEVCKKTGISERAYLTYEFGEREPKISVIEKLADFYGVSTDYLLGRTTVKHAATEQPDPLASIDISAVEKRIIERYTSLDEDMRAVSIELFKQLSTAFDDAQPKQRHIKRLGDIEDELRQEEAKAKDVI